VCCVRSWQGRTGRLVECWCWRSTSYPLDSNPARFESGKATHPHKDGSQSWTRCAPEASNRYSVAGRDGPGLRAQVGLWWCWLYRQRCWRRSISYPMVCPTRRRADAGRGLDHGGHGATPPPKRRPARTTTCQMCVKVACPVRRHRCVVRGRRHGSTCRPAILTWRPPDDAHPGRYRKISDPRTGRLGMSASRAPGPRVPRPGSQRSTRLYHDRDLLQPIA
jgi:hypothetical protein